MRAHAGAVIEHECLEQAEGRPALVLLLSVLRPIRNHDLTFRCDIKQCVAFIKRFLRGDCDVRQDIYDIINFLYNIARLTSMTSDHWPQRTVACRTGLASRDGGV